MIGLEGGLLAYSEHSEGGENSQVSVEMKFAVEIAQIMRIRNDIHL